MGCNIGMRVFLKPVIGSSRLNQNRGLTSSELDTMTRNSRLLKAMSDMSKVICLPRVSWTCLVLIVGLGWSSPAAAQATCPPGLVELLGTDDVVTGSVIPDSPTDYAGWPFDPSLNFGQAFNVDWNQLRSRAYTITQRADHGIRVIMAERFQLAAGHLEAREVQLLTARLSFEARVWSSYDHSRYHGPSGSVRVILTCSGTADSLLLSAESMPHTSIHSLQSLPFPIRAEESFSVTWEIVESEILGSVEVNCQLEFVTPNGGPIELVSCRGVTIQTTRPAGNVERHQDIAGLMPSS
jgi:hypothetical protein